MQILSKKTLLRVVLLLAAIVLSGCGGDTGDTSGGGAGGEWYYHWNCNGDSQCLALGPAAANQAIGTLDEGPVQVNCTELQEFSRRNWGMPPATDSCDQNPNGTSGATPPPTPPAVLSTISVTPGTIMIGVGATQQYVATGHYSDGTTRILTGSVAWSSLTPSCATITFSGLAKGISTGSCTIKATLGALSGTATLTIVPALSNFTPVSGTTGTEVYLTGSSFPITLSDISVTICGLSATVISATSTQIDVLLPTISNSESCLILVDITNGGNIVTLTSVSTFSLISATHVSSVYYTVGGFGDNAGNGSVQEVAKGGGTAVTLATNLTAPGKIISDSSNVYWLESGNVSGINYWYLYKSGLLGGTVTEMIATNTLTSGALAQDSTNLYYTVQNPFRVGQFKKNQSSGQGWSTSIYNTFGSIAVDATNVYWTGASAGGSPYNTAYQVSLTSGSPIILASDILGTYYTTPADIAVDALNVYWVDYCSPEPSIGTIKSTPIGGGTVTTLVTGMTSSNGLASDGTYLYWSDGSNIYREFTTGGAVTTIASGLSGVVTIVMDSTTIYWAETSSIKSISKTAVNGTPTVLVSGLTNANGIAIDLP